MDYPSLSIFAYNIVFNSSPLLLLQALLAFWVIWYVCKRPMRNCVLNEKDKADLINNWIPEQLISSENLEHDALIPRVVTGIAGHYITVDGTKCLNMATHNYLGFIENTDLQNSAIETVKKYGVGSCGPRGFYGTLNVHLNLEERLAEFMDCEEAVVYSYGFSTAASAIPAYCKRNDVIFADENLCFSNQKGIDASRSTVYYFKHNDMTDLEKLIQTYLEDFMKKPKSARKAKRLFLIVEGIYMNTGEICPLPELIELRKKYKLRMFLDETISFGVLGATGRGITEHFGVDRKDIDLIIGSLEWSLSSIGGFCVGSSFIIDHQRLSGQGYCFSASLPPLLTQVAINALDIMERSPDLFLKLKENCKYMHRLLKAMPNFKVIGHELSPIKHLRLRSKDSKSESVVLKKIIEFCFSEKRIAITQAEYIEEFERCKTFPSIRLTVSAILSEEEMNDVVKALAASADLC